jgi:hypothetical protein
MATQRTTGDAAAAADRRGDAGQGYHHSELSLASMLRRLSRAQRSQ